MRNASLEGIRGAAALFVVLFHLQADIPWLRAAQSGYLAVDLFFVLSGYVICGAYRANVHDASDGAAFIVRRFGRLWPVHVLASACLYALAIAATAVHGGNVARYVPTTGEILAIVFLAQGLNLFDHSIGTSVSWSAGDEFYVYILFASLCVRTRGRHRVAAFVTLAVVGYSLAIWASVGPRECLARGECFNMTYAFGWSRCLAGFFIGALIAEYRNSALVAALAGRVPQALAAAVALLFLLTVSRIPGGALAAPVVFAALIASMSRDTGPVARLFQASIAQYLGRVSYSLYLAHAVFLPFALNATVRTTGMLAQASEVAVYLFASFVLAHILCKRIEIPCRQRINAWVDRTFSRAPVTSSGSIAG